MLSNFPSHISFYQGSFEHSNWKFPWFFFRSQAKIGTNWGEKLHRCTLVSNWIVSMSFATLEWSSIPPSGKREYVPLDPCATIAPGVPVKVHAKPQIGLLAGLPSSRREPQRPPPPPPHTHTPWTGRRLTAQSGHRGAHTWGLTWPTRVSTPILKRFFPSRRPH